MGVGRLRHLGMSHTIIQFQGDRDDPMKKHTKHDLAVLDALQKLVDEIPTWPTDLITPSSDPRTGTGALLSALKEHPLLGRQSEQPHGLYPSPFVATLRVPIQLRKHGPQKTLEWLYRLCTLTQYEVRHSAELIGVEVDGPVGFSNGVHVIPSAQMRPDRMATSLWNDQPPRVPTMRADSCGMVQLFQRTVGDSARFNFGDFVEVSLGLTIGTTGSPVVGLCWEGLEDEDLNDSRISHGLDFDQYDGKPPKFDAVAITSEAKYWTERYIAMDKTTKAVCGTAAKKLNLACRRTEYGDMAIELTTGFEAILGTKDERSELTYRFSLRSALLMGHSIEEKQTISRNLKSLYNLRSKFVHGEIKELNDQDTKIVQWGVDHLRSLLRLIVGKGALPNYSNLEFTADPSMAFPDA